VNRRLADWIVASETMLDAQPYDDRIAAVTSLLAQVAIHASVQGRAIPLEVQREHRSALARHLVSAVGKYFNDTARSF